MRQILHAVSYCHQNNIVHRDLNPQCILLADKSNSAPVKLSGFGIAVELPGARPIVGGTTDSPVLRPRFQCIRKIDRLLKTNLNSLVCDLFSLGFRRCFQGMLVRCSSWHPK